MQTALTSKKPIIFLASPLLLPYLGLWEMSVHRYWAEGGLIASGSSTDPPESDPNRSPSAPCCSYQQNET